MTFALNMYFDSFDNTFPPVRKTIRFRSLKVESAAWNDRSDVLIAIADGRLVTWYYPSAVSIDRDLLALASISKDAAEFGKVNHCPRSYTIVTRRIQFKKSLRKVNTAHVWTLKSSQYTFDNIHL